MLLTIHLSNTIKVAAPGERQQPVRFQRLLREFQQKMSIRTSRDRLLNKIDSSSVGLSKDKNIEALRGLVEQYKTNIMFVGLDLQRCLAAMSPASVNGDVMSNAFGSRTADK